MNALAELGIMLRSSRPGEHRAACPECARTKRRPGDDALAVRLDPDGSATWCCHRCTWSGSTRSREPGEHRPRPASRPEPDRTAAQRAATSLWRSSRPIKATDTAGRYLRARGCSLPSPDGGLRWSPDVSHPSGYVGAALVGLITDAVTAEPMSIHRTWICPDGTKAPIDKPRLLWPGLPSRGVVRLCDDGDVTLGLALGEGIETSLAAATGFGPNVWACLSAGSMAAIPVLAGIEALTIIADHDAPDRHGRRAGEAAAAELGRRWRDADREVRIWVAPAEGIDLADIAQAEIAA